MGIPFGDPPFAFSGTADLLPLGFLLEFPVGASELIPFVTHLDCFFYSRSADIPSRGFLLVFPRWGFTLTVLFAKNYVFPRRGFTVLLLSWGTPCYPTRSVEWPYVLLVLPQEVWPRVGQLKPILGWIW